MSRTQRFAAIMATSLILGAGIILGGVRLHSQQAAGQAARDRQVQVFPVVCDLYADGYRRGVLSLHDVRDVLDNAPAPCPSLEAIMHKATGER